MRVLVVSPFFYPATCFGGPVRSVHNLIRGLIDRGVDVEVITTSANEPVDDLPRTEKVDGATIHYIKRFRTGGWFFAPGICGILARLLPQTELIDIHLMWNWLTAQSCIAARHFGKPYILTPRGNYSQWAMSYKRSKKAPYFQLIDKKNVLEADAVHCLNSREADQVRTLVPEARCEIIPNAVTIDPSKLSEHGRTAFFSRFPILSSKRLVLLMTRIHPIKGFDLLIPAFARVVARFPDAHLVIAGPDEGGYRIEVEHLIEAQGIEGAVTFTGLLNGQDKLAAFDCAEVFVLPSYSEGLPVVVLEAMAFGKPVVITDACNLTEDVRGSGAGLVADRTPDSLASAIESVLADRALAQSMGEAGRRLVAERFSLETVTDRLIELFRNVIAGKETSACPS